MFGVYTGERVLLTRVVGPVERVIYRLMRTDPGRRRIGRATRARHSSSARCPRGALRDPAHPGHPPAQPRGLRLRAVGRLVQQRRVVRVEHQLAVLRRRDDDDVRLADGRPGGAELRLGRRRHGRADRGDPRARVAVGLGARQLLGRRHALAALRPAADLRRRRPPARLAGHAAVARALRHVRDRHRRRADARPGPGRLAGGHQGARHQRRRLLQRQLGDAVREPQRIDELRRDAAHPRHPGRADGDVRPDGRQPPPRAGRSTARWR